MKIFEKFNEKAKCYVCGTNEDKPCTLFALDGTKDGNNEEAVAIHIDCIPTFRISDKKIGDNIIMYGEIIK